MLATLAVTGARASVSFSTTFNSGSSVGTLPGPSGGSAFTGVVSYFPAGMTVGNMTVDLVVSGGVIGNFVAQLYAPNNTVVTLMYQPGVAVNTIGAYGSAMNITLTDAYAANGNIQNVTSGDALSGNYNPAAPLSGLNGSVADGTWSLYFVDFGSGSPGVTPANLTSWTLGITAVPEPITWALIIFGAGALLMVAGRWCWVRFKQAS